MNIPDVIPLSWKLGAALALAAAGTAYHHHVYQQGFDTAVDLRAARDGVALVTRVNENTTIGIKQDAINAFINKDHDEKLTPVRQHIAAAPSLRVGTAICGPAAPAQAEDAGGGNRTDPPGRLVRPDVDRDIRALKLAVEEDLATGRACQAFGRENGFWP